MKPGLRFLSDDLAGRILDQARDLLGNLGLAIHNQQARELLAEHGAPLDRSGLRVLFTADLIDQALATAPSSFPLFNSKGEQTHDLGGDRVHFAPGSSAIHYLDPDSGQIRSPQTSDYLRYAKVVDQLPGIDGQSTAFIPTDVPGQIQDSYRLFLSLLHGSKPVVTGAFTVGGLAVMRDLLVAVRGSNQALRQKPLAVFSCAPTTPLSWSDVTCQHLLDCSSSGIPVEIPTMPLAGFTSPVTVTGTLIQHTAETLSGVVLSQLACPGAPVLYGGSPAPFDIRYETTPMGAAETWLLDAGLNELGSRMGLPTQAYIALSDAKALDAQAGLETGMGALVAVLSGINNVSGPGMLDFENCHSVEKLIVDNEVVGLARRLGQGITPRDDFPARPLVDELLHEGHLLISNHSLKNMAAEHHFPDPVLERANLSRWQEEGSTTVSQKARSRADSLVASWQPPGLSREMESDLIDRMTSAARQYGQDSLPDRSS